MTNAKNVLELLSNFFQRLEKIEEFILESKQKNEFPENEFLTVEQAAKFLDLATSTIYGRVHKRTIPFMKKGRRLYFSREDLTEYLLNSRRPIANNYETNNFLAKKGGQNA